MLAIRLPKEIETHPEALAAATWLSGPFSTPPTIPQPTQEIIVASIATRLRLPFRGEQ